MALFVEVPHWLGTRRARRRAVFDETSCPHLRVNNGLRAHAGCFSRVTPARADTNLAARYPGSASAVRAAQPPKHSTAELHLKSKNGPPSLSVPRAAPAIVRSGVQRTRSIQKVSDRRSACSTRGLTMMYVVPSATVQRGTTFSSLNRAQQRFAIT